jgi:hypothetical protein
MQMTGLDLVRELIGPYTHMEAAMSDTEWDERDLWRFLEEVYGNAQMALRLGADRESLLAQIDEALQMHEEAKHEPGWIINIAED